MEDIAGDIHEILAWILVTVAGVHGAAALKHHFYNRDNTLLKMLGILKQQAKLSINAETKLIQVSTKRRQKKRHKTEIFDRNSLEHVFHNKHAQLSNSAREA